MPTYRYSGPHDSEPHQVVAESYAVEDADEVIFFGVTSVDPPIVPLPGILAVRIRGEVEVVE
jgi:hypothetical protein